MTRLYRLLLRAYPAAFREEHGAEMCALFEERRRRVDGIPGLLALWWETWTDVFVHAVPMRVDGLRQDLRFATRSLWRSRAVSVSVLLVAALGIGANTAVFTVTDVVMVRPLPFEEPDRLVRIWERVPGYNRLEPSPQHYRDWRAAATSFAGMAAFARQSANLVGSGEPVRFEGAAVTASLLPLLGVRPLLGRWFTEADDTYGAGGTILLSHATWQRDFAGDQRILGRSVVLDGEPYVVVGVMPATFRFPDPAVRFWIPIRFGPSHFEDGDNNYLGVIARLQPEVTIEQARFEMEAIMAGMVERGPTATADNGVTIGEVRVVSRQSRLLLLALVGASLSVLIIACTNIANLLLARGIARSREMAVRSALGAGSRRLVRQLLVENLLLATLGGALGVLAAMVALPFLTRLVPGVLPTAGPPAVDARVLGFAVALTFLTAIGFGAAPALRAGRVSGLVRQGEGTHGAGRAARARGVLVVVQVTASVALLVVAGLMIRALSTVQSTDPGFRADGVLTLRTWLPWPRYERVAERGTFHARVVEEVRRTPGVTSAAYTSFLPIAMGGGIWDVEIPGRMPALDGSWVASLRFITPGYFETLEIPLIAGRDVTDTDTQDQPPVAVVSASFARQYFPGEEALGKVFTFGYAERTVVGIVGDVRVRGLDRTSEPQVYLPHEQVADGSMPWYAMKDLVIRTTGDPLAVLPAVRDIIRDADPDQPVSDVRLLAEIVAGDTATRRDQLRVLGTFALLALLLAAIGIHGLLSFTSAQRSREIGLRYALGASRRGVLAMVLRDGARLAATGVALGALAGWAAGQSMRALLAGIPAADLLTFATAIALAFVIATLASLPPALRAARLDPADVIRNG